MPNELHSDSQGRREVERFDRGSPKATGGAPNSEGVAADPTETAESKRREDLHLMDVAPTILSLFDLPIPGDMRGRIVL